MITICKIEDIRITSNISRVDPEGWDFPVEKLGYLLEEHPGETFVLMGHRLHEALR